MPYRLPLFGAFAGVVALMALGHALVAHRGLREELLFILQRELLREMELARPLLRELDFSHPDSAARALSRRLGQPVTLLDLEGRVVGASSLLPFQLRGLVVPLEAAELEDALRGGVGFSERRGYGEVELRLFGAMAGALGPDTLLVQVSAPLDEVQRVVRRQRNRSLALAAPALLLSLLFTALLGRGVVRPLKALTRRARSLSAGYLERRLPRGMAMSEVDELAGAFNRMAEEVQGRVAALEGERDEMVALIDCMGEAVIALTRDARVLRANRAAIELLDFPGPAAFAPIGALVRHPLLRELLETAVARPFPAREITLGERQLLVSARGVDGGGAVVTFLDVSEIRRLETVRRDFVANASHELKTPLTALRGFAETLLEDDPPEELRRSFLDSIRANTLRLQHLVDGLLDLSRLESGGWVARMEEVELAPLVEAVWGELAEAGELRGLDFQVEGGGVALADEQGVAQVLRNLLDNAIRYSPGGGRVRVELLPQKTRVRVAVRDTGIGIPSHALGRIFERFYRVDPARSRGEGGTGLGLAIVRHLVQAMGGEVWAESELGRGTTVFFTLPAPRAGEADPSPLSRPGAPVLSALLLGGGALLGCGGGPEGALRGLVKVDGSSSLYPVAEAVSEEFQLLNPRVMVATGLSGTGGGMERFCRGETDVATASRQIRPGEEERCRERGVAFREVPVALDGISVVVNPANTFVECLTVGELRRIWEPRSRVRSWRDVRPEFPGERISLFGPGTDSGTFDHFTEAVVGQAGASRTDYQASEDDNVLVRGIFGDRFSLGYLGRAYHAGNPQRLKLVAVDGGEGCVLPREESLREGRYRPLGRLLYLYVKEASLARPGTRAFLEFFLSHAGEFVAASGYIPLPADSYRKALRILLESTEAHPGEGSR